jgi:hypothetical protein
MEKFGIFLKNQIVTLQISFLVLLLCDIWKNPGNIYVKVQAQLYFGYIIICLSFVFLMIINIILCLQFNFQ